MGRLRVIYTSESLVDIVALADRKPPRLDALAFNSAIVLKLELAVSEPCVSASEYVPVREHFENLAQETFRLKRIRSAEFPLTEHDLRLDVKQGKLCGAVHLAECLTNGKFVV